LIWPRLRTWPSILFLANRVLIIIVVLVLVFDLVDWTTKPGCLTGMILDTITGALVYLMWALFSTLRVFALAKHAWPLSILVFILSMVPFGLTLWVGATTTGISIVHLSATETVCIDDLNVTLAELNGAQIGIYASLIAADLVVLAVTWTRTYRIKKEAVPLRMETPLATMLLRDGTVYFLGFLAMNIVQTIVWALNLNFAPTDALEQVYTSIVISRFLLDLRQVAIKPFEDAGANLQSNTLSRFSNLRFASRIVDNMGADLDGTFGIGTFEERPGDDQGEDGHGEASQGVPPVIDL